MLPFLSQNSTSSWGEGIILGYVRNPSLQSQILCKRLKYVINFIGTFVAFYQSEIHSRLKDDGAPSNLQMSGSILEEKDSISLLGHTVISDLSWKSYTARQ